MTPFRCRHGWHNWQFVAMSDTCEITQPGWISYVCHLTERCRRCGLTRTSDHSPIPKRVRT